MTMETTVTVPASRQVTLTLPPETPEGRVTLTYSTAPVRENPDTPEFRNAVRQSRETLSLLQIWIRERQARAIGEGRSAESAIGEYPDREQRHAAFHLWRAEYERRQAS